MTVSKAVLDASVLIEVAAGNEEVIDKLLNTYDVLYANKISLAETRYVLCRGLGAEEAEKRTKALEDTLFVVSAESVWEEASDCKCKFPISLGDCFTLATSKKLNAPAVFLRKEKEIVEVLGELEKHYRIVFLEDN